MATIQKAERGENPILDEVELPYAMLDIGGSNGGVVCMEQTREILAAAVQAGALSADEASEIEKAAADLGLVPDWKEFFSRIAAAAKADTPMENISFQACSDCTNPIQHGHIYDGDGRIDAMAFFSMRASFDIISELVLMGNLLPAQGAVLIGQMVAANIPTTEEEITKRFNALDPAVREELESRAREQAEMRRSGMLIIRL